MLKHLLYLKYLVRHKWFVGKACWKHGLFWKSLVHDWNKFLPDEWIHYAEWFYGYHNKSWHEAADSKEKETKKAYFNRAWLKHQNRSSHHWQYWVLIKDHNSIKPQFIPVTECIEMVCDWYGAGVAITGENNLIEWYEKNKNKIQLEKCTRIRVNRLVETLGRY